MRVPGSTRTDAALLVAWLSTLAASWIFVLIMGRRTRWSGHFYFWQQCSLSDHGRIPNGVARRELETRSGG